MEPSGKQSGLAPQSVSIVGLGRMGTAVARRLLAAGYVVRGHDVSSSARKRASDLGVSVPGECAASVTGAATVITLLPDPPAVESVAGEILDAAAQGSCWIEMSSSHPALTRELAERASGGGVGLLDAPVAGGVAGAEQGSLTIMAAGPVALLTQTRPLLEVLGERIVHVSERPGDGDVAKTINNLLAAANLALASEGLALGLAEGLDAEVLLDVLNASSGGSFATRVQIPSFALSGGYDARFTVGQYAKDLGIALDVAERRGISLQMSTRAREVWQRLVSTGHGDDDYTRIVQIVAAAVGVALPHRPGGNGPDTGEPGTPRA